VKDVVQEDLRGHCPRGQRRSFCKSSPPRPPALAWLHVCVPLKKTKKRGPRPGLRGCPACERGLWLTRGSASCSRLPATGYTTESQCRVGCLEDAVRGVVRRLVPVTAPHHHHRDLHNAAPVSLLDHPQNHAAHAHHS